METEYKLFKNRATAHIVYIDYGDYYAAPYQYDLAAELTMDEDGRTHTVARVFAHHKNGEWDRDNRSYEEEREENYINWNKNISKELFKLIKKFGTITVYEESAPNGHDKMPFIVKHLDDRLSTRGKIKVIAATSKDPAWVLSDE